MQERRSLTVTVNNNYQRANSIFSSCIFQCQWDQDIPQLSYIYCCHFQDWLFFLFSAAFLTASCIYFHAMRNLAPSSFPFSPSAGVQALQQCPQLSLLTSALPATFGMLPECPQGSSRQGRAAFQRQIASFARHRLLAQAASKHPIIIFMRSSL